MTAAGAAIPNATRLLLPLSCAAWATAITKMAQEGQAQNYDLDRLAMEQMTKSWKDELLLIVFLTPMLMAFVPGLEAHSLAGFSVIAQMPEWYRYIIIGMVPYLH